MKGLTGPKYNWHKVVLTKVLHIFVVGGSRVVCKVNFMSNSTTVRGCELTFQTRLNSLGCVFGSSSPPYTIGLSMVRWIGRPPSLVRQMEPGMVVWRGHLHEGIHHIYALLLHHLNSLHNGTSAARASLVAVGVPRCLLVTRAVVLIELEDIMGY